MSVLIKGMEMPTSCLGCGLYSYNNNYCPAADKWVENDINTRQLWCPLIEISTPHGRLIDADALIKRIPTNFISIYCVERILEKINTAPTIIPAQEGE